MSTFGIGHTGILWGRTSAEEAVKDVSELGYAAYETSGSVLVDYEQELGGFGAGLGRYGIPLSAAYCQVRFYDPADAGPDIEQVMKWAKVARGRGWRYRRTICVTPSGPGSCGAKRWTW